VPERRWIDTWSIALGAGPHLVAVLVQPATAVQRYDLIQPIGLWLRCTAGTLVVVSDGSWQARMADWAATGGRFTSLPTGWQEHHDLAAAGAWTTDPGQAGWAAAFDLGPAPCRPWATPAPRPIPLLDEADLDARVVWRGVDGSGPRPADADPARWFNQLALRGGACDAAAGWIAVAGDATIVLDAGRTRLLRWGVEAEGDLRLDIAASTHLGDRPEAGLGFESPREGFADSVHLRDGAWWRSQPRGARFVTFRACGSGRFRPRLRRLDFPYAAHAGLETGDPFLAALWRISRDTLASSSTDVLVDTCHREHVLWTMDACASGLASWHLHGDGRLWGRCLDLIGRGVDAEGVPQAVVPADGSVLLDQTCWWVRSLADWHLHTGDRDLLAATAPAVRRFLGLCLRLLGDDPLFTAPAWSWHFVDWAAIDKRRWSLPINALLCDAAAAGGTIASAIGDRELAAVAATLHARLLPQLARFFDPSVGAFRCHLADGGGDLPPDWACQPHAATAPHGIHANALALHAGAGDATQQAAAASHLGRLLRQAPGGADNAFGPGWSRLILGAASAHGAGDAAWSQVRALCTPLIEAGCPTWPERFGGTPVHNSAHGWGAALASWLVEHGAGLRPLAPGYGRHVCQPASWWQGRYRLRTPAGELTAGG
jgi:hypothetical protein